MTTAERLARAKMMAAHVAERVGSHRLTVSRRPPDWIGVVWCDVTDVSAMTVTIRVPWRRLPMTVPLRPGELERLYRLAGGDQQGEHDEEEPHVIRQARLVRSLEGSGR